MGIAVSFIIPTLNETLNIERCLSGIGKQTYDHAKIEILVADGGSTDNTRALINAWSAGNDIPFTLLDNERKIAELGKAIAIQASQAEFFVLVDADNEIIQEDWLERALQAFDVFPDIYGYEPEYPPVPGAGGANNYLTGCLHFNDPLANDIATPPRLIETRIVNGLTYRKWHLLPGYPCGANGFIYRRQMVADLVGKDTFEEGQVALHQALRGNAYFATIDGYGIYHYYVDSMRQFLKKRAKIALKHMTRKQEREEWVQHTGKRLYLYAFLHLTLLYPFARSIYRAVRYRDPRWLYDAPMCFLTSFLYLVNWIDIKLRKRKAW